MIAGPTLLGALLSLGGLAQAIPATEGIPDHVPTEAELFAGTNYVYQAPLNINPNYDADFGVEDIQVNVSPALERRTDFTGSSYFCRGRWVNGIASYAMTGIDYLYKVQGKPRNGAGPGNCGRVSCSGVENGGTAIWWCNDENKPKELQSFGSIADGALWLWRRCMQPGEVYGWVAGQVFHKTNWNVIISMAYC
ncbi:hypothetical protein CKAH01_10873 [Colletotrichum kahawae]|uniref:Secreted protein n=1 Tax=Colletotrichum kahawae TaxID=34407 RepID=A0AAD9XXV1_COLKA|nr:hypothetical protein CKAH01_10873 [Colletotrichum kahawae]